MAALDLPDHVDVSITWLRSRGAEIFDFYAGTGGHGWALGNLAWGTIGDPVGILGMLRGRVGDAPLLGQPASADTHTANEDERYRINVVIDGLVFHSEAVTSLLCPCGHRT